MFDGYSIKVIRKYAYTNFSDSKQMLASSSNRSFQNSNVSPIQKHYKNIILIAITSFDCMRLAVEATSAIKRKPIGTVQFRMWYPW